MTRILMDGFEHGEPNTASYGGTTETTLKYGYSPWFWRMMRQSGSLNTLTYSGRSTTKRSGNYAGYIYSNCQTNGSYANSGNAEKAFTVDSSEIYGRVYFNFIAQSTYQSEFIKVMDTANNQVLKITADGTTKNILVYDYNNVLVGTITNICNENIWYKIEFHVLQHSTTGKIRIWFNDTLYVDYTGNTLSTRTSMRWLRIGLMNVITSGGHTRTLGFDDVAVNDTTGSTNNGRCGNAKIIGIVPKAAGTYSGFTPLSGANYTNVDEIPIDGDTTYNSTSTPDTKDTYVFQSLQTDKSIPVGDPINAVWASTVSKYTDTPANIAIVVKTPNGEVDSSNYTNTTSYQMFDNIYNQDPTTNTNWTVTKVDASEFGVKHKSV